MPEQLRWGILGTGNIAGQFTAGLKRARLGVPAAVASRDVDRAGDFAQKWEIPVAYGQYQELLDDRNLDAIYISLPNSLHHAWSIDALKAGKHVMCEKPLAMTAAEGREMFDAADRAGKILMEAFMYRSQPLTLAVRQAVAAGAIGQLRLIQSSFCYRTQNIEGNVRFSPKLGGGALMDVGCYCIDFSRLFAGGEPTEIHAVGRIHERGVDDLATGVMRFAGGINATFASAMSVAADNTAYLCGTDGYISIPIPWKPPQRSCYMVAQGMAPQMDGVREPRRPNETYWVEAENNLYAIEADDFAATILEGKPPRITRQDSLGNLKVLEEMRRQIGVSA